MIRFGAWSTVLALGMAFGTLVAVLLLAAPRNRAANALLAAAMAVIVLKLAPYMLGFAGFYDAHPWLTFAPLSFGLALGPLLYLHVARLTQARMPRRWAWHLVPAALQLAYYLLLFVQPLAVKEAWSDAWDAPLIDPAETALELVSLAIYAWLCVRRYRDYQAWLDGHLSNREEFRLTWLRNVVWVLAAMVPPWVAFELLGYWRGFDYFQRFPLYVALSALLLYLGLEGWRHAANRYPVPDQGTTPEIAPPVAAAARDAFASASAPDWHAQGQRWHAALCAAQWWRDPDLSLARLARHLGTNTNYLTRALNEGLGRSFNEVVNRLRVDAVRAGLDRGSPGPDLLTLAHDAGFSSKTSFNRLFKRYTGMTPSQYRRDARGDVPNGQ